MEDPFPSLASVVHAGPRWRMRSSLRLVLVFSAVLSIFVVSTQSVVFERCNVYRPSIVREHIFIAHRPLYSRTSLPGLRDFDHFTECWFSSSGYGWGCSSTLQVTNRNPNPPNQTMTCVEPFTKKSPPGRAVHAGSPDTSISLCFFLASCNGLVCVQPHRSPPF